MPSGPIQFIRLTAETKSSPCCAGGTLLLSQHVLLDLAYVIERHGACSLHAREQSSAVAMPLSSV